jgi:hypothetical protein
MAMRRLRLSRKGFFFTMVAVALSIVLILSFKVYDTKGRNEKNEVIAARIFTLNDFIRDVESDMQKGLYIASKRTFLGMQEYITEQGAFLPSTADAFEEGMLHGTIEGIQVNFTLNATFTDWTRRIQAQAETVDIVTNITILSITLHHFDPWTINVTTLMELNASDGKGIASWSRVQEVSTKVSIIDLEDPLYVVSTSGKVTNTVRRTNSTPFVQGGDVTNLIIHTNESYYVASSYSPSYLMRLEGNLSPSSEGMESLVNVVELLSNGVPTSDRSVVDAVYFGTGSTTNFRINMTPSWFKLDEDRLGIYGVTNITI